MPKASKKPRGPRPHATNLTESPRQEAEWLFHNGITELIAAFNLTGAPNRPWGFDRETQQQAERMLRDLCDLFHNRRFEVRMGPVAQGNAPFQRFMQQAIGHAGMPRN